MARTLEIQIIGDSRSAERALGRTGAAADSFGSRVGKVARGAGVAFAAISAAGATVATLGGFAVKAAVDFESSFAGVRKTVDASETELKKLSKGFLDLSRRIPVNVNALNEIGEAAGQLGIQKKSILKFTETIAKLGVSSNLAGEEGAAMLARFANITRMPQGQFDRLGATIVALGNAGASTEKEIAEMALRLGAAGTQVGMTQPQILGLANALSSVGIEAEAGGSAMSTAMVTIAKAVATGGSKVGEFAKVAGMSATEFSAAWKKDASGALVTFIEGLGRVKSQGGNVFAVLDKLGLGSIRVRDALLRSAGAGDLLRKSLDLGKKAWTENIALNKEAEQRFKTTAKQIQLLKNNVQAYAIVWGAKLLPAINSAILKAGDFVRRFAEASGFEAKMKVVVDFGRKIAEEIQSRIGAAIAMVDWGAVWSKAQGIGEGLAARFEQIDWSAAGKSIGDGIAVGVGKASAIGKKLADSIMESSRTIDWTKLGKAMGPGITAAMVTAFVTLLDPMFWIKNWDLALAVALVGFGRGLGKLAAPISRLFAKMGADAVQALLAGLEVNSPKLASLLLSVLTRLPALVSRALSLLIAPVKAVFSRLGKIAQFVVKVLGIQAAIEAVGQFVGWVKGKFSELLSWIRGLPDRFATASAAIGRALADGIIGGIGSLSSRLYGALKDKIGGAISAVKGFFGISSPSKVTMQQIGTPLGEGVLAGWVFGTRDLPAKMKDSIRNAIEAARAKVEASRGRLSEAWSTLASDALSAFDAITGRMQTKTEKALAKMQAARDKASRDNAVTEARAGLASALAGTDGVVDPQAVQQAQKSLDDALFAQREFAMQKRAEQERRELDAANMLRRRHFEQQIAALGAQLAKKGSTAAAATASILKLLGTYGVDFKTVGETMGRAWITGLKEALEGAAKKSGALSGAISSAAKGIKVPGLKDGGAVLRTGLAVVHRGETFSGVGRTPIAAGSGGRAAPVVNNFHFPNYMGDKREIVEMLRTELVRVGRGNPNIFGGLA